MSRNPAAAAASRSSDEVVRFDDVSMRYGRGPDVLSDVSFSLAPGSFHFITGPSGAGKTSLLKLIYLAARPSRGSVHLFGQDVAREPASARPTLRRRIGVVFPDLLLLEHLSAFDNAALPLRIAGHKPAEYRNDVAELLSWVGLGGRMSAMPPTLAGGERQRLAIARAVVNRPELLLADEPTGNVDHEMALRIFRLFVELNRLGTTVLIATHDQDLIARSGRPVLHLEGGRVSRRSPLSQPLGSGFGPGSATP
jgi:cell division transport system ATP-binding protein